MMTGLTSQEAAENLKIYGFNELPSSKSKNVWKIIIEVIKEPMFLLLITCGLLYVALGDYTEGLVLVSWVLIIIFISFFQHRKTERALETLKQLSSPRALVIRDGKEIRIAGREVVRDDIVILNEGDRVPADGVLLENSNLTIDESLLTGESIAVQKDKGGENNLSHVFSGTLVVQGKGIMRVLATGTLTEFGKIGKSLQNIVQTKTNLQKEMGRLIRNLFIGGIVISIIVVIAFYLTRNDLIQSFLNGLATAMAMLPEEFPVVLTVFLAIGAWRLSRQNVLTRKPSAIETLGAATVLCSDKTGTITQNKMSVVTVYTQGININKDFFDKEIETIAKILKYAYYATDKDSIDPMERAILETSEMIENKEISGTLLKEYPFSKDFFASSKAFLTGESITLFSKGAPEVILSLCQINKDQRNEITKEIGLLAQKGQRVIAVAHAKFNSSNELPDKQQELKLNFEGLIGFEDPIRPEVPEAIRECRDAGIKVIMITGDYPITAKSIANQAGFREDMAVMTGDELNKMDDEELMRKIQSIDVFARTIPEQKLRIIQALKNNNEVVAMTGDGVNDAPALKAADIGIAMGEKGTDVARESSSLVLLDDNFNSIVSAIRSGRRIYDNLQKAMFFIIAIHIPIIGLTLLPAFFPQLPILLFPLHIVFLELIIDPACSIAFEAENEEIGIMKRPPRDSTKSFFGIKQIFISVIYGVLLLAVVMSVYFITLNEGHSDGEIRTIAFSTLIIGNLFLILTTLSKTRYAFNVILEKNISLIIILVSAIGLLFALIKLPFLQKLFSFENPGLSHFIISLLGSFVLMIMLEGYKYIKNK